ncbi:unnamed protein product [Protopolystoma xenopodis]|uniref:Uncharacterized protein n=1 Tax=Protopolystoma xenopodis TaxID=117903 RepID=A0A3S5B5J6_9PLAT|nr:unnamed protein product [Protopolystoma xenopodis]
MCPSESRIEVPFRVSRPRRGRVSGRQPVFEALQFRLSVCDPNVKLADPPSALPRSTQHCRAEEGSATAQVPVYMRPVRSRVQLLSRLLGHTEGRMPRRLDGLSGVYALRLLQFTASIPLPLWRGSSLFPFRARVLGEEICRSVPPEDDGLYWNIHADAVSEAISFDYKSQANDSRKLSGKFLFDHRNPTFLRI